MQANMTAHEVESQRGGACHMAGEDERRVVEESNGGSRGGEGAGEGSGGRGGGGWAGGGGEWNGMSVLDGDGGSRAVRGCDVVSGIGSSDLLFPVRDHPEDGEAHAHAGREGSAPWFPSLLPAPLLQERCLAGQMDVQARHRQDAALAACAQVRGREGRREGGADGLADQVSLLCWTWKMCGSVHHKHEGRKKERRMEGRRVELSFASLSHHLVVFTLCLPHCICAQDHALAHNPLPSFRFMPTATLPADCSARCPLLARALALPRRAVRVPLAHH